MMNLLLQLNMYSWWIVVVLLLTAARPAAFIATGQKCGGLAMLLLTHAYEGDLCVGLYSRTFRT